MKLKDRLAKLRAEHMRKRPKVVVMLGSPNGFECRNLNCQRRLVGKGSVFVTKVDDSAHGEQVMHFCKACARQVSESKFIDFKINLANLLNVVPLTRDYGPLVK